MTYYRLAVWKRNGLPFLPSHHSIFVQCLWPEVKVSGDVPDWVSKFPMCIFNSVFLKKFKILLVKGFLEK